MGTCLSTASKPSTSSTSSKPPSHAHYHPQHSSDSGDSATKIKWGAAGLNILPACEPIRLLGEGTFGTVVLVRERATQKHYAVKVMNKSQLVNEDQLDNIIVERQVLREAGPHPFIVECYSGFQTPQAVVLVLEYVPGGDMYDLLKRHGCLTDADTRFYLAEIVVALAELHRHNFVFRDLKLENILIDVAGHCRLTDFGLAGKVMSSSGSERQIFDISGTAIYQAPEMLAGKGHGRVVDWWALGVLAYVLLAGRPPFSGDTREALFKNISSHQLNLDEDERVSHISDVAKDFILRLLDKNPETRLGAAGNDAKDVQSHPYFEGVDWDVVSQGKLEPPLSPGVQRSNEDSSADDVQEAQKKLAEKILRNYKPSRATLGKLREDLDSGEYKMVMVRKNDRARRVSIGLDFAGKNQKAAAKTWANSMDDFGRELTTVGTTSTS